MRLHWSPRSPFVRKVMVVAHETGLVPQLQLVRSVAAMSKPNAALMIDNPLSKIPTLVLDSGAALFDSAVICEYLDSLHQGEHLFPKSGDGRWRALRWQALSDGLMDVLILWRNERERAPAQQFEALLLAFGLKVRATLALLEREIADIGAAPFGIGQISLGCALGYLDFRFEDLAWRNGHGRLQAWYEQHRQRQSMRLTSPDSVE